MSGGHPEDKNELLMATMKFPPSTKL